MLSPMGEDVRQLEEELRRSRGLLLGRMMSLVAVELWSKQCRAAPTLDDQLQPNGHIVFASNGSRDRPTRHLMFSNAMYLN